jgi:transposase-like protein
MTKRVKHTAAFKAKIALEALKEQKTLLELSQDYKLHPTQITRWKSKVTQELSQLFEDNRERKKKSSQVDTEMLYAQIGKLQSQLEFLKKKMGLEST